MSELVRLYRYKSLLSGRSAISAADLMATLEISRATLNRDIAKLRDQLHVPIEFNSDMGGYTLDPKHTESELPGLWFSQSEILALVTIQPTGCGFFGSWNWPPGRMNIGFEPNRQHQAKSVRFGRRNDEKQALAMDSNESEPCAV